MTPAESWLLVLFALAIFALPVAVLVWFCWTVKPVLDDARKRFAHDDGYCNGKNALPLDQESKDFLAMIGMSEPENTQRGICDKCGNSIFFAQNNQVKPVSNSPSDGRAKP